VKVTTWRFRYCGWTGIRGERQEEFGELNHASVFIHDDHTTGPHHSTDVFQGVGVYRDVEMLDRDTTTQRAARLHCLEFFPVLNTSSNLKYNLTQSSTHWYLNQANVIYFTELVTGNIKKIYNPMV